MLSSTQCGQSAEQSHVHLEPQSLRLALCCTGTRIPTNMQLSGLWSWPGCLPRPYQAVVHIPHPTPGVYVHRGGLDPRQHFCVLLRTERQPWVTHATFRHRGRVSIQYFCVSVALIMIFWFSRKNWGSLLKWTWGQILTQSRTPLIHYTILSKLLLRSFLSFLTSKTDSWKQSCIR